MSKSCQLSVSHINIIHGDEILLLATKETSTPTSLYTYLHNSTTLGELVSIIPQWRWKRENSTRNFRTRRRGFQDFLSKRARHQRPGGICTPAQLVGRDALHLAIYETWELGTIQINYRTLAGNHLVDPELVWTKHFLADIYIYIHIYNYTTTQIHTKVPNTIKWREKPQNRSI